MQVDRSLITMHQTTGSSTTWVVYDDIGLTYETSGSHPLLKFGQWIRFPPGDYVIRTTMTNLTDSSALDGADVYPGSSGSGNDFSLLSNDTTDMGDATAFNIATATCYSADSWAIIRPMASSVVKEGFLTIDITHSYYA